MNSFKKASEDKKRIRKALKEGTPLNELEGIKFATPFKFKLVKRTTKELEKSRCKAYKYMFP